MILDIIVIIFIVALSLILCRNDTGYNCHISHIIVGLSVMVFYKLARVLNLKKSTAEGFYSTNSITDFLSGNLSNNLINEQQAQALTPAQLKDYSDKLDSIINALNTLNNQSSNPQPNLSISPSNIQKLDLESQQQYQMFQIDYLNKQIQNAKDIINSQKLADNNTNYKPIKVYSSCIISNADGTTSLDVPVTSNRSGNSNINGLQYTGSGSGAGAGVGGVGGAGGGAGVGGAGIGGAGNISTSGSLVSSSNGSRGSSTSSSNFINLSPSTGVFNKLLNNIAQRNGNININL
jgi:hypothetical protein